MKIIMKTSMLIIDSKIKDLILITKSYIISFKRKWFMITIIY